MGGRSILNNFMNQCLNKMTDCRRLYPVWYRKKLEGGQQIGYGFRILFRKDCMTRTLRSVKKCHMYGGVKLFIIWVQLVVHTRITRNRFSVTVIVILLTPHTYVGRMIPSKFFKVLCFFTDFIHVGVEYVVSYHSFYCLRQCLVTSLCSP